MKKILIVTPSIRGTRAGNRITSLRHASLLRQLGCHVHVHHGYEPGEWDVLFALHAVKNADAIHRSKREAPERPVVLILTGTDIYGGIEESPEGRRALEEADRLVILQPRAMDQVPEALRGKTRLILQSARPPQLELPVDEEHFDVCVIAHLRPIKDPLLTARAVRRLPTRSRIRVVHVGGALDEESRRVVEAEQASNDRFSWQGAKRHGETLSILARSRLLVVTSHNEGGPTVVTEAFACGVPVLSTRIPAAEGLLGVDHPGLFPTGDEEALASLLLRCSIPLSL